MRFREFVLNQPCASCNGYPVDPDHNPTRGSRGNMDHDLTAPLCRKCHTHKGNIGVETFERAFLRGKTFDELIDELWIKYARRIRQGK